MKKLQLNIFKVNQMSLLWVKQEQRILNPSFSPQAQVNELKSKEQQFRNRLEGLGRLMSLLATKVAEALRRYELAQVRGLTRVGRLRCRETV